MNNRNQRKMIKVVNHVKMDDEDGLDVVYWLQKTPAERIAKVTRLRINYFTWLNGAYPSRIEKVVNKRSL